MATVDPSVAFEEALLEFDSEAAVSIVGADRAQMPTRSGGRRSFQDRDLWARVGAAACGRTAGDALRLVKWLTNGALAAPG